MSREIKFRAWHKADGKMYKVYGFSQGKWFLRGKTFPMPSGAVEVMQYTGLKDKNGVEIYEGDIISFDLYGNEETEKGIIMCDNGSFVAKTGYSPALDGTHHGHPLTYQLGSLIRNDKAVEVIGNIYENPELIERD
ncbi:YopX family protein [Pseudobacillus badius]|uniref:YopX family protein n=1 Tax=Bacillus badius TaxID=1455 RepID=UPI0007B0871C|nr:YopX family protein [Bacillus badius]KZN99380.1 hypothetical protein A4244_18835 [Bacillus badius]OCS84969.1 hypothetical protein A6M11_18850 [Bacillus badius]OVE49220.1 hypothetical protein B1A98_16830 [Bacillus badius]TDW00838.1 putative phage protein (TIGR01671 family) [Bacillus badius]